MIRAVRERNFFFPRTPLYTYLGTHAYRLHAVLTQCSRAVVARSREIFFQTNKLIQSVQVVRNNKNTNNNTTRFTPVANFVRSPELRPHTSMSRAHATARVIYYSCSVD